MKKIPTKILKMKRTRGKALTFPEATRKDPENPTKRSFSASLKDWKKKKDLLQQII